MSRSSPHRKRPAAFVAVVTLLVVACGGASPPPLTDAVGDPVPLDEVVAAAAQRTSDADSGSFELTKVTTIVGKTGQIVVSGQFASQPRTGSSVITLEGELFETVLALAGDEATGLQDTLGEPLVEFRTDERYAYIYSQLTDEGQEAEWVRMKLGEASALVSDQLGTGIPFGLVTTPHLPVLELVASADQSLTRTGPGRSVAGTEAAGYVVAIEPLLLASEAMSNAGWQQMLDAGIEQADLGEPIEVSLWVTAEGNIGVMEVELSDLFDRIVALDIAPREVRSARGSVEISLTVEIGNIGEPVSIQIPSEDEVADVDVEDLPPTAAIGDCLPNGSADAQELFVAPTTVSCEESHVGEIYGIIEYPSDDNEFPGHDVLTATADAACFSLVFDYVGGPQTLSGAQFMELSPTEMTWEFGDRTILCLLIGKEPLTGSLKDSVADLGLVSVFDMDPGTCFADEDLLAANYAAPISCSQPHGSEVVSRHLLEGTVFPGDEAVAAFADEVCESDPATATFGLDDLMTWLAPFENTWEFGDRTVFCIAELQPARSVSITAQP